MTLPQDMAALAEEIVNTLTATKYQHVDKIDPAALGTTFGRFFVRLDNQVSRTGSEIAGRVVGASKKPE